jgi:MFS family permease
MNSPGSRDSVGPVLAAPGQVPRHSSLPGLVVLCGALALVIASIASIAAVLPAIGQSTGATQGELAWIADSSTVVFAGLLLPFGALGDKYGRRRVLSYGLVVFAGATLAGPVFDSPHALIVSRALAGVGAAMVMPATLSLITGSLRGAAQDRAVGLWAAIVAVGGATGLVGAGVALEFSDWRGTFYASAAVAGLLLLAMPLAPESAELGQPRFDLAGALTSAAAIGLGVFGILEAPAHGWDSWNVGLSLAAGLALFVVFIVAELKVANPLLDIRMFRSRPALAGTLSLGAQFAGMYAFLFLGLQYLQLVQGRSALDAAAMMAAICVTVLPLSLVSSALVTRFGLRVVMTLGMLAMVPAFALMQNVGVDGVGAYLTAVILCGATFGLCGPPATTAILRSAPANKQGVASGINDAAREVGASLGIAVSGSLLASGYANHLGPAAGALPEPAREQVHGSLAAALEATTRLGPAGRPALAEAQHAFLSGMHISFGVCAVFSAVAAIAVAAIAPGRSTIVAPPVAVADEQEPQPRHRPSRL